MHVCTNFITMSLCYSRIDVFCLSAASEAVVADAVLKLEAKESHLKTGNTPLATTTTTITTTTTRPTLNPDDWPLINPAVQKILVFV